MNLNFAPHSKRPSPIASMATVTVQTQKEFIDLIKTFMKSHYQDVNFCVAELAMLMNTTASTLTRKVFELTGHTPAKLILHYRLSKACYLLLKSNEQIKSIAWLTGFQSQANFCRSFIKVYKISPSKYRESQDVHQHSATYWKIPINMFEAKILLNHAMQHQWLQKLLDFALAENFNHAESMPQLAKLLNITPSTLSRKLKTLYPITPARFVRDLRLQYASELLGSSGTITAVALTAGFFDHSHFCRCFKTVFGTFPSSFKQTNKDEMPVSWLKEKLTEKIVK